MKTLFILSCLITALFAFIAWSYWYQAKKAPRVYLTIYYRNMLTKYNLALIIAVMVDLSVYFGALS